MAAITESSQTFLWGSAEDDVNQLLTILSEWAEEHRNLFGSVGPQLSVSPDVLAETYDLIHLGLSVFGSSANACKRASTVVVAISLHCPIVAVDRETSSLSPSEQRALLLANAKAAFEIGEAIARVAVHHKPKEKSPWNFKHAARFPSLHSYVEFISSISKLRSASNKLDMYVPAIIEQATSRIALILEILFYRTNPEIAGISDAEFWTLLSKQPGYFEFTFLNLDRNCDDHVKLPDGFKGFHLKRQPAAT